MLPLLGDPFSCKLNSNNPKDLYLPFPPEASAECEAWIISFITIHKVLVSVCTSILYDTTSSVYFIYLFLIFKFIYTQRHWETGKRVWFHCLIWLHQAPTQLCKRSACESVGIVKFLLRFSYLNTQTLSSCLKIPPSISSFSAASCLHIRASERV